MCVCLSEGVGAPLSVERTRMLLVLRINVLAKGHSGISMETLDAMIKAFNGNMVYFIPLYSLVTSCSYSFTFPKPKTQKKSVGNGLNCVYLL